MIRKAMGILFLFVLVGFLTSCATQPIQPSFQAGDVNSKLRSGMYMPKVDQFLVILDGSTSMADRYNEMVKLEIAKNFVSSMNQTIPDIDLKGRLRTFGQGRCLPGTATSLIYKDVYSRSKYGDAINKVKCTGGTTPMMTALEVANDDLNVTDRTAVIIVSDGIVQFDSPIGAAQALKDRFGGNLCISTVLVGNDAKGKALMEQLAGVGQCGTAARAEDLTSGAAMADFVEKVFLASSGDSDGDGVPDHLDQCPGTMTGVKVDEKGCPLDSDGDGVPDLLDACPNTPRGTKVDAKGCPISAPTYRDVDGDGIMDDVDTCPETPKGATVDSRGCWVLRPVLFGFDKATLSPSYFGFLNEVAVIMMNNPDVEIEVNGHTDNVGTAEYNMGLSEKRAQAVVEFLVDRGVGRDRFSMRGYGFTQPVATNQTDEGRAQNRRAVLIATK
jgi:OOP family OmpA-OmpF porin